MSSVATGQMSALETGKMLAVKTGQMSADAETRQMSAVATIQERCLLRSATGEGGAALSEY